VLSCRGLASMSYIYRLVEPGPDPERDEALYQTVLEIDHEGPKPDRLAINFKEKGKGINPVSLAETERDPDWRDKPVKERTAIYWREGKAVWFLEHTSRRNLLERVKEHRIILHSPRVDIPSHCISTSLPDPEYILPCLLLINFHHYLPRNGWMNESTHFNLQEAKRELKEFWASFKNDPLDPVR
jgi:hypothetical protein